MSETLYWKRGDLREADLGLKETLSELQSRQATIAVNLHTWYIDRESDSLKAQRERARLFYGQCDELKDLVHASWRLKGYKLQLITGEEPIDGAWFEKGAYDMYSERRQEIAPNSAVDLRDAQEWTQGPYSRAEKPQPEEFYAPNLLFVGDFPTLIPATTLAKTIHDGAMFKFAKVEPAEQLED